MLKDNGHLAKHVLWNPKQIDIRLWTTQNTVFQENSQVPRDNFYPSCQVSSKYLPETSGSRRKFPESQDFPLRITWCHLNDLRVYKNSSSFEFMGTVKARCLIIILRPASVVHIDSRLKFGHYFMMSCMANVLTGQF